MSGFFTIGEKKDRPGIYKRRENVGSLETVGARAGIGCAVVTGDWGPLGVASLVDAAEDITKYVGTAASSGYKTVSELFRGGVQTAVIVRAGSGGANASVTLKDNATTGVDVVTVASKYPGTMPLSISIKASLTDAAAKDVTIYTGTTVLEKYTIEKGEEEVDGIVDALAGSAYVTATKVAAGSGTLKEITQTSLAGGTNPTVTNADYSAGFEVSNTETWDVICVDTNDTDVHALLATFCERIFQSGDYPIAVVSEPTSIALETRMTHAKAFDDEKVCYVLDGWIDASDNRYEGYLAAARLCGMVAAIASNDSLTHKTVSGAVSLIEPMTNTQIVKAIQSGCLVISRSKTGSIIVEKAINTMTTIDRERDAGWKKIRRVKTRFEMMYRIETALEQFIGSVNNDPDGRAAIIAAGQAVLDAMVGEGKVLDGAAFALDESNPPQGDSAWFVISADDNDSFETGYLTFRFRFAPEE